jgi:hypothetical protein
VLEDGLGDLLEELQYYYYVGWATQLLKGTHARDFHSPFLNFFLHLSVTNRYKTQNSQHF